MAWDTFASLEIKAFDAFRAKATLLMSFEGGARSFCRLSHYSSFFFPGLMGMNVPGILKLVTWERLLWNILLIIMKRGGEGSISREILMNFRVAGILIGFERGEKEKGSSVLGSSFSKTNF